MYLDDCIFLKCCYHRILLVYSPRMWRWSSSTFPTCTINSVFSTYVEMIPKKPDFGEPDKSILHVCGDDPKTVEGSSVNKSYSPRMWRWSYLAGAQKVATKVFSTYVEMIPTKCWLNMNSHCILHVCGDDPLQLRKFADATVYSPRMWRWSCTSHLWPLTKLVFSTYVEMIPKKTHNCY